MLTKIIDPTGGVTLFETDDAGNIVKEIEPNGDEVEYLYDQHGAHTRRVDASGQILLPMPLEPHRPDGLRQELPENPAAWIFGDTTYDGITSTSTVNELMRAAGLPHTDLPPAWGPLSMVEQHDAAGRVSQVLGAAGHATTYNYDWNDNVTHVRDSQGSVWSYRYKSWNLVDQQQDPRGGAITYDYNLREEVIRVVDPEGTTTEFEYDDVDRVIKVTRNGKTRDLYSYTAAGQLKEKYDSEGNLLLRLEPGPYDTYSKIEFGDGTAFGYEHNERARITKVKGPDHLVELQYDLRDQVCVDLRNGVGVKSHWLNNTTCALNHLETFDVEYRRTREGAMEIMDPTARSRPLPLMAKADSYVIPHPGFRN